MRVQVLICLLAALWAPGAAQAAAGSEETEFVYQQDGGGERCFYEFLLPGQEALGSFEVAPTAGAEADFVVRFRDNMVMFRSTNPADNYFFTARVAGQYSFCISARPVGAAAQPGERPVLRITFRMEIRKPETSAPKDPFTLSLEAISDTYTAIQTEQRQGRYREKRLVDDVSSVNRKVWLFFFVELVCVLAAYGFQAAFLTQIHKRV